MGVLRWLLGFSLAASGVLAASDAHAGTPEEDARQALMEGLEAEKNGGSGCEKFRVALGLIRELGPLLKVKECDLREGKLVAAKGKLTELIANWREADGNVEKFKAELAEVERKLARVSVALATDAPAGVRVRIDGNAVAVPTVDLELDPGEHEMLVEVPGRPLTRTLLDFAEGERPSIVVPQKAESGPDPKPPIEDADGGSGLLIGGITLSAVGGVGLVVGGVLIGLASGKSDEIATLCGEDTPPPACDGDPALANALVSEGETFATGAYVGFGIGGAALATGLILAIVGATSSSQPTRGAFWIAPAPNGVLVGGGF